MSKPILMFVDDEPRILRLLDFIFREDYAVLTAESGKNALELMAKHDVWVVVSDQRMPEMTGIQLLAEVHRLYPNTIRMLLTGYSDLVAIIGAVNEGEVFRFLNKPWNQDELKSVVAEAMHLASMARQVAADSVVSGDVVEEEGSPPLAKAAMLLAVDGVDRDRHEVVEMFTEDYHVVSAASITEAQHLIERFPEDIGVVVADVEVAGQDSSGFLSDLTAARPWVTTVMLAKVADSETVIKLINDAQIYRFAMKPVRPNVFRLAVSAAMKEHHRRLARERFLKSGQVASERGMVDSIVSSLGRFTKLWP